MTKTPTMAELRIECAKLGITPARSLTETMARIEDAMRAKIPAEVKARLAKRGARREARPAPSMSRLMRHTADSTSLSTGILRAHPIVYQGDVAQQRMGAAFVVAQLRQAAHDAAAAVRRVLR